MGPTKRRAATNVKYNLQEYDDMIKSALQEEELAQALAPQPIVPNTGTPKLEEGVKMTYSDDDPEEDEEEEEDESETEAVKSGRVGKGKDMGNIEEANAAEKKETKKDTVSQKSESFMYVLL